MNSYSKRIEKIDREIIERVRKGGDTALFYYSKKFDGVELKKFKVSEERLRKAFEGLSGRERQALKKAAENIRFFAKKQMPKPWETKRKGIVIGEIMKPIELVGVYVPAGKFPLVSSVLMNCIPAKVAGVERIVLCTPPAASDKILAAAYFCGVKDVYLLGGAQAIAAMAFGTETIPKVDKIVGPGNIFVSTAKRLLYGTVDIDMPAGPSEVLVFAEKGRSDWIAAELFAQAEHDEKAKATLVTTNSKLAKEVKKAVEGNAKIEIVRVKSAEQAIELINRIAPEHLVLFDSEEMLPKIKNAGSIFLGKYSAVAFGDYCSGTNHVLPTSGFARVRGGLSPRDFVKMVSYQRIGRKEFKKLSTTAKTMASMEGMTMHKKSVEMREETK